MLNNQIYRHTVMKQRKVLSTHRQSELTKSPVELPGPSRIQQSTNPPMKVLCSSLSLKPDSPWVSCISCFIMMFFHCSARQLILKLPHCFPDYLEVATAVVVSVGVGKTSPRASI